MKIKDLDLIAINETYLDEYISDSSVRISNYELIRENRNRQGGGVAIYLRTQSPYLNRYELIETNMEAICLDIVKPNSKPFWFKFFLSRFRKHYPETTAREGKWGLTCNFDPLARVTDYQTNKIIQLTQLIDQPTRVTEKSSTPIDVAFTNATNRVVD